jgi:hypothetical protein
MQLVADITHLQFLFEVNNVIIDKHLEEKHQHEERKVHYCCYYAAVVPADDGAVVDTLLKVKLEALDRAGCQSS